ncbi:MAG: Maf family protein [Clostridiaceae bacterium]|nr:Maf family protein [Clostridiaceae bacterium]MBW4859587.1 Maf family protein [Clostridiaceae bacterium]MBW4868556.1 Maf family protein [Clostridiaceae bacterium]
MEKIVLASSSPRRKELLLKCKIQPLIVSSNISEQINLNENPEEVAMSLAYEKAYDVSKKFKNGEIIIGADTLVCLDENILGKPKDEQEAFSMLKTLNNREHFVITGLAIIKANTNLKIIGYEKTAVTFRHLTDEKIKKYIEIGEYKDKAGAYAVQGSGEVLVEKIVGCYSNVVGLPIAKLDTLLERYFNVSLL